MKKRVGILTSGGDCPGLNATIRGVAKALYARFGENVEIVGILNGYHGLITGEYKEMCEDDFRGILTLGGTILGTKRTPFKLMRVVEEDKIDKVAAMKKTYKDAKLDCLLCLGGNGTHKTANLLSQEGLNVIGLPKTIDNDIYGTDVTFGFHTAVDIATEVIDRIHTTAGSHSRVMCIEIMGNKAGWLTLYSGIAGGADIILIDRYEAHMKKVAEEGMHFTIHQEEDGGYKDYDYQLKGFRTYTTAADAAAAEGKVDVIIYMTKATQLEQAIQDSMPVVGDTTVAVSLINGLGNDDNLFKVFPKERCIIGSGVLGTALPEPAHCVSTPAGGVQMNFGGAVRSELTDAACAEMLKCYRAGGCDAYWRDGEPGTDNNIYKFIWKKVCVNATVNTVCAVLRLKIGEVEADPFGQWLFHSVIRETCAVATAKGVPMDADEFIAHDHKDIVTNIADYYPSMCQDMLFNHRQTEIDVLNGKIAEYGEQLGIDTPVCKVLSQVVRCIQGNYDKQYLK